MKDFSPLAAKELLPLPGAEIWYWPQFFPATRAESLLADLIRTTAWRQDKIRMFGREHFLPRLTAWYGDAGKSYSYSGIFNEPLPWTPVLAEIKAAVDQAAGQVFNSVLLNYYRHGQDSMGWHSDDEPELGPEPVIASLSFGQPRRFDFRHRHDKTIPGHSLYLDSGSLLLMQGQTQQHWQHQLPKTARPLGPRVNLTFRIIR